MIQVDKITRDDLRAMQSGETRIFQLPTPEAVESGKTSAYTFGKIAGARFKCEASYANRTLTITRYDD